MIFFSREGIFLRLMRMYKGFDKVAEGPFPRAREGGGKWSLPSPHRGLVVGRCSLATTGSPAHTRLTTRGTLLDSFRTQFDTNQDDLSGHGHPCFSTTWGGRRVEEQKHKRHVVGGGNCPPPTGHFFWERSDPFLPHAFFLSFRIKHPPKNIQLPGNLSCKKIRNSDGIFFSRWFCPLFAYCTFLGRRG